MGNVKILSEEPLTLSEVKTKLTEIKKRDKELSERGEKVREYLETFASLDTKKVKEIREKLVGLNIPRLKERHYAKVIDIMPTEIDSLRLLFSAEAVTVKQEDLKRIVDIVNEYT
ncbi:MAG: hypothetical protein HYS32_03060 [Candidatus Woesearchaeota archaeon]|nr:MAG: hypothetical protein HYS32_03060 [Candidatus Woesearchaeota archaeon]